MDNAPLEDLINKINKLDYHNSFIKELNLFWDTSYQNEFLYNYESLPSLFINVCVPESNNYLILKAGGVFNYNPRILDDVEIFVESYVGYYRLYINSKNEYPNSFIEFKELNNLNIFDISS